MFVPGSEIFSRASSAPLSASANIPKGDVTIKDIMGTYVYENYLYGIKMNGNQIKKYLEYSARYYKQVSREKNLQILGRWLIMLGITLTRTDQSRQVGFKVVTEIGIT